MRCKEMNEKVSKKVEIEEIKKDTVPEETEYVFLCIHNSLSKGWKRSEAAPGLMMFNACSGSQCRCYCHQLKAEGLLV